MYTGVLLFERWFFCDTQASVIALRGLRLATSVVCMVPTGGRNEESCRIQGLMKELIY